MASSGRGHCKEPGDSSPSMPTKPTSETQLYAPVRDMLVAQGYEVQAEVDHCDITATQEDELLVIELKLRFSVDLLAQACERLRITDSVYVAIPKPVGSVRGRRWRRNRRLLRRLGLGLLVVDLKGSPEVDIVLHPLPYQGQKSKGRKRSILQEMAGRTGDRNVGGSTGKTLVTAYREDAVFVACALEELGPQTAVQLRKHGAAKRSRAIMYDNHYGWFERIDRGVYRLSPIGQEALGDYPALVARCRKALNLG